MNRTKRWECHVREELYNGLFLPRLGRITLMLKGKKPKAISARQKTSLKRNIEPDIIEALKGEYKAELKGTFIKSFKLREKRTKEQIDRILDKFKKYNSRIKKFIYTLWEDRHTCLYVGQTTVGPKEITLKDRDLLRKSRLLKIYEIRRTVHLDKYEGIALHVFAPKGMAMPKYNKAHPGNASKKCPFCRMKKRIKREIDNSFVLVKRG